MCVLLAHALGGGNVSGSWQGEGQGFCFRTWVTYYVCVTKAFNKGCKCGPDPRECLSDDEWVTQLTEKSGTFKNSPRKWEVDFSVIRGRLSTEEARESILGLMGSTPGKDRVRYARVGDLRKAGFTVVHTPSKKVRNSPHTSVVVFVAEGQAESPWHNDWSSKLQSCFNEEND